MIHSLTFVCVYLTVGVDRLLRHGIFTGAFPLHEVIELQNCFGREQIQMLKQM